MANMDDDESMELGMEHNSSSKVLSDKEKNTILLSMSVVGIASTIVCLIALVIALKFKLHRYFVHRLAIYQVVSALLFSVVCALEIIFIDYDGDEGVYQPLCMAAGFALLYTGWLKLMFTFCLTFHLFCFAVFYVNLNRLELVYVLVSVIVPLLFCWIPFVDEVYGQAGAWCWIQNWQGDNASDKLEQGEIEQYALLYVPAISCLFVTAVIVIIVIVVLICRAYNCSCVNDNDEHEPLLREQKRKKVLREMLPLVSYPILSLMFYVPAFINRVIGSVFRTASFTSFMWGGISLPLIGLLAGVSLIVHIFILKCPQGSTTYHNSQKNLVDVMKAIKSATNIFTSYTIASTGAKSLYEPLSESEYDRMNCN